MPPPELFPAGIGTAVVPHSDIAVQEPEARLVSIKDGATVAEGDVVVVLEAMKMEQPLKAHKAGVISGLSAQVGATVGNGEVLCEIKDA